MERKEKRDLTLVKNLVRESLSAYWFLVFRKTASILAFIAVFQIMGGHWIVLQSFAWGKMVVDYSQNLGFLKGFAKTFDGAHPCGMCDHVQKESLKENSDSLKTGLLKLLKQSEILPSLFSGTETLSISTPIHYLSRVFLFSTRLDVPPTPPPLS